MGWVGLFEKSKVQGAAQIQRGAGPEARGARVHSHQALF